MSIYEKINEAVYQFEICKSVDHWEDQILFGKCEKCGKEIAMRPSDLRDEEEPKEDKSFSPEENQITEAEEKAFEPDSDYHDQVGDRSERS